MKQLLKWLLFAVFIFNFSHVQAQAEEDSTYILGKSRLYFIPTFSVSNKIAENQNQLVRVIHASTYWTVR